MDKADTDKYRLLHIQQEGLTFSDTQQSSRMEEDLSALREQRTFTALTLTAEIARYLNRSCLEIEDVLRASKQGMDAILQAVNEFNELLYDWIIPRLFQEFYEVVSYERHDEEEIQLVKKDGQIGTFSAKPELVVKNTDDDVVRYQRKSFHLDTYCFDSMPEKTLFLDMLRADNVEKVYFTGMLTHGQSDFYIHYIDPDSHAVRSYFPDFLVQKTDGTWMMIEVKGDNKIDDPVVHAKAEFARSLATANTMQYVIVKGSDALAHGYRAIFEVTTNEQQQLF